MEHAPTWLTYGFLYLTAAVLAVPQLFLESTPCFLQHVLVKQI